MLIINGDISFNDVKSIVVDGEKIEIDDSIYNNIDNSFNFLESFRKNKIIYGITTGFGPMAQYRVNDEYLYQLQYNIIRSHSTGAGDKLPDIYVRAAMLSRLNAFLRGYSGVHRELIDLMVNFLNLEIYPVIPAHGGVGASGDLVQMAHLALALIGEGKVSHKGDIRDATEVLKVYNLKPLIMHIREGLALANGTSMMTGIGLVNLYYSKKLLKWSILSSLMMNEITGSYDDFASERLNGAKPHYGQQYIAQELRRLITSSKRLKKRESELYSGENHSPVFDEKVQSFYSIRCIPQILGPISDEIDNAEKVLINELNSANDNPIVDFRAGNIFHGGNFHGDYVSFEMDKLKIAITKLTMLAERQLNYLYHDKINGILPPFVNLGVLGLNYGMQAAQFTATSTTAECQTLSNPMYVHSIPNNNDNQDIVSMGTNSALIASKIIANSFEVLSILFISILQAVDYLKIQEDLSQNSRSVYNEMRNLCPIFVEDTPKYEEIASIVNYLKDN